MPYDLRIVHEGKVWCPHCGDEYDTEEAYYLYSYHGEESPIEVYCSNEDCEKTFWVTEYVHRTFASSYTEKRASENEGEAKFKG